MPNTPPDAQSTTASTTVTDVAPCPLLDELRWRGQLHQCTNEAELAIHLGDCKNHPRSIYTGFDPTADSLTIGNLVPIMLLKRAQLLGHRPVVVMGGGTGLIGDPSGKSAERQLLSQEQIETNIKSQTRIFESMLDFDVADDRKPIIVNNYDWLKQVSFLEMLRDVGKHFSVNMMIQKDSVRDRLHNRDQGISYTEFSYMILQAYDFVQLHLDKDIRVTVQAGGSDQWGNIVAGIDLIRRITLETPVLGSPVTRSRSGSRSGSRVRSVSRSRSTEHIGQAFGLTVPLVTKSDGGKFGKTESGAVWLTPERTTPFAFHQFWLNTSDDDAQSFLHIFTLLDQEAITQTVREHAAQPYNRLAQKTLADHMTDLLYGKDARERAVRTAGALFSGNIKDLAQEDLDAALADAPSSNMSRDEVGAGDGISVLDLLVRTKLASSRREAREFLQSGAVTINGDKAAIDDTITDNHLLHGTTTALRRGKKKWHVIRWS